MNIYLQYAWEYVINLLETGLFYFFIRIALTPKILPKQTFLHMLGIAIRFTIVTACDLLAPMPIYGIIICSLYHILFTCVLFKDSKVLCIFWGTLHGLLCLVSELITTVFLQISMNILPSTLYDVESSPRIFAISLYIVIVAALSFFVPMRSKPKTLFNKPQKIFVTITVFLGIIITHCFYYMMAPLETSHPEIVDILILTNIIFLCIFFSLLIFIYQLAITQQEKEELQEKARLLELEEVQYRNLLSTTETLRSIKHDIHHHLATIESLIQQNETERLTSYLKEYQTHFNLDYTSVSSGNIVIDSILSTKQYFAKQQHIELSYAILLPDKMPFTDVALSALLGNLFDNAMEACSHITESDRFIHFQMKTHENMLLIHIENSFDGIINEPTKHVLLSRKREVDHGIGLKRVKTLVEEVNGFTDIRYEKNTFIVHIIAPLETTHEH